MGRPNWYYDHPPMCSCKDCSDARLRGRPSPLGRIKLRVPSSIARAFRTIFRR